MPTEVIKVLDELRSAAQRDVHELSTSLNALENTAWPVRAERLMDKKERLAKAVHQYQMLNLAINTLQEKQ